MPAIESAALAHLQRLLAGAQLPALPQSAIRVLEISRDPNNGPAEYALAIEADPGLATQVLKFVNSSYFGFSRAISSVKLAITLVGIHTIKNFALWNAVFSLVPNPKCGPFDLQSLWHDCLCRGLFVRFLARTLKLPESEELFAAALLQDMAIPMLAKALPQEYGRLLEMRAGGRVRLSELERARFGWTHAEAAAQLATQWKFDEAFVDLLRQHSSVDWTAAEEPSRPLQLIGLSAMLPAISDDHWHEVQRFESAYERLAPQLGIALLAALEQVDRDFAEFAPLLKLADGGSRLTERYQQALNAAGA
jgi:HD-like signal output (HDOD) protein